MKARYVFIGLYLVLALAFGFALLGCEDDPGYNTNVNNTQPPPNSGAPNPVTPHPDTSNQDNTRPNAPTNVSAVAASSNSITVSWSAVPTAKNYLVYRSAGTSWLHVGTVSSTSFTVSGLAPSMVYYFYVSAWNSWNMVGFEESNASATVWAETPGSSSSGPSGTIPNVPTNINVSAASSSSINISWLPVSGATGYQVYRSSSATGTFSIVGLNLTSTSFTDTGLSANTTYFYKVTAYNNIGESDQSQAFFATTQSGGNTGTIPNTPTNLTATAASSSSITVNWSAVSGATGYHVYRSASAAGTYSIVGTVSFSSFTNTGLSPDTTYHYMVAAYNNIGESTQSQAVSATTQSGGSVDHAGNIVGLWSRQSSNGVFYIRINANGTLIWGGQAHNNIGYEYNYTYNGNTMVVTLVGVSDLYIIPPEERISYTGNASVSGNTLTFSNWLYNPFVGNTWTRAQ